MEKKKNWVLEDDLPSKWKKHVIEFTRDAAWWSIKTGDQVVDSRTFS